MCWISQDRVILHSRRRRHAAKTTMMSKQSKRIEARSKRVFTFAPSADASRGVLRDEGFKDAETVRGCLRTKSSSGQYSGQVIWIDEASLLG